MHISIFIKPHTGTLREIKSFLEQEIGKKVRFRGEKAKEEQIVIYNGRRTGNFKNAAHELWQQKRPDWTGESPFLIRAGSEWTKQGLVSILKSYAGFQLLSFRESDFPAPEDSRVDASEDEDLLRRLKSIKRTAENCGDISEKEVEAVEKILSNLRDKSVAQVKREILYHFIDSGKISLPWGNPPTSRQGKDDLIEWLKAAHKAYPRNIQESDEPAREWHKRVRSSPLKLT